MKETTVISAEIKSLERFLLGEITVEKRERQRKRARERARGRETDNKELFH